MRCPSLPRPDGKGGFMKRPLAVGALLFICSVGTAVQNAVGAANVSITEFGVPTPSSNPRHMGVGPDHNVWFTEEDGNKVARVTAAGVITEFPVPTQNSVPDYIVGGPDGNLWFTEQQGNKIAKMTTAGLVTEFPVPTASSGPHGIVVGPDGNLWFTE